MTADYTGTVRRDPAVPQRNEIHFVQRPDLCRPPVGWNPVALFRDSQGTIVGGTRQYVFVIPACADTGRETWVVPRKAIPPTADDARTGIYPYCDIH